MPAKLKLTYALVEQIVELKRDGLCDADIIAAIGVHQATFYRWLKEGENAKTGVKRALYEELKKAEAQYKRCLLTTIKSAAESRAQYWTAAAWLLERKYPMEYGKMERKAEEADNAPVQLTLGLVIEPMADDSDGEAGTVTRMATNVSDFVIPRFHPVLGDVMAHGHTHYWLPGGRGSTKSSFISIAIVLLIIANPKANAVVVRRFSNTLRDSVYQQIQWAIEVLGLEGVFRCRVSPMEITYTPTGQRIVFRGADDPLKLKGVKFTKGYCSVVWFEELDQFEGVEAVRSILNSLRRGGDRFWIFYSYNPPKTMWSWVNVERLERVRRDDTLVRGSSYLDVIETHPDWLGAPFVEEAEYLRDTNEQAWRWEYLGEITGTGGAIFDNVHEAKLSDSRIRTFQRVRNGVDWGWFPDPWRFVRCAWEPDARRLLIFEEHSANKMMPADTGRIVVDSLTFPDEQGAEAYFHDQIVYCDDTPDSKVQMNVWRRELGIRVHAARKARMRRLSYEWLAGLREIVIDPERCPLTFSEFTLKEFEKDKEGNWIDEIPDGNDHSIDAVRYAMMDDVLRG